MMAKIKPTRILIGSAHSNDARPDGNVFIEFIAVAHRIKERCIVIQIENIEIDSHGRRQTRTPCVLGLNYKDVVLHL